LILQFQSVVKVQNYRWGTVHSGLGRPSVVTGSMPFPIIVTIGGENPLFLQWFEWVICLINLLAFCYTPWICIFINSLISWLRRYWIGFFWHWQRCTVWKYNSINLFKLLCSLLFLPFYFYF